MQPVDGVLAAIAGAGVVFLIVLALLYFLPTIIAFIRRHDYRWIILVINLFLGATVLGWIASLIWALWPRNGAIMGPVLVNATNIYADAPAAAQPAYSALERRLVSYDSGRDEHTQPSLPRYIISGAAPALVGVTLVLSALVAAYHFIPESFWARSNQPTLHFVVTRTTNARSGPGTGEGIVGTASQGELLQGHVELGPNQVARWLHVENGGLAGSYVSLTNLQSYQPD